VNERGGCATVLLTGLLLVLLAPFVLLFWPISLPALLCWWIERRRRGLGLFLGGTGLLLLGVPLAWTVSDWGFVRFLTVPIAMSMLRAFDGLSYDLFALTLPWVALPTRATLAATFLGLLVGGCLGAAAALAGGRRTWMAGFVALVPVLSLPILRVGPEMDRFRPPQAGRVAAKADAPGVPVARPMAPDLQMVAVTPGKKAKRGPFRLSATQITCAQWAIATPTDPCDGDGDRAKTGITWVEAIEYCNRVSELTGRRRFYAPSGDDWVRDRDANGYRLPYDAEWSLAAQGKPVGLLDLADGVAEWMWDSAEASPGKSSAPHLFRDGDRSRRDSLSGVASNSNVGFRLALDGAADP
jgi:hypothetical protein